MTALDCMWTYPSRDLSLEYDDVHVWRASLSQSALRVRPLAEMLSVDERMKAERFQFDRDRVRFILGRGILRVILSRYLHIDPSCLRFHYELSGKPTLAEPCGSSMIRFNLSHSGDLVLYAVTRCREIGVDLECIRPISDAEAIARCFFSVGENAIFHTVRAPEKMEAFFNCWTRKEAYIKAVGDGLARPLDQFEVSFAPGENARLLHVQGDLEEAARWSLRELTPAAGYVAALAVEGHDWRLACWQWTE